MNFAEQDDGVKIDIDVRLQEKEVLKTIVYII